MSVLKFKKAAILFFSAFLILVYMTGAGYTQSPVTNMTTHIGYSSISNAIKDAGIGSSIMVNTGVYLESIKITNFNSFPLHLYAWDFMDPYSRDVIIDASGFNNAVLISNSQNVFLFGFAIKGAASSGVIIKNPTGTNQIFNNLIYSNSSYGIKIEATITGNKITGNLIRGGSQINGIYITNGNHNVISDNYIHNNSQYGVYLAGSAEYNNIINNEIYSNTKDGVCINSDFADNNVISFNRIFGPGQERGIGIEQGDNIQIYRNLIKYNQIGSGSGITINSTATNISVVNNTIVKNIGGSGVYWGTSTSGAVLNNIIMSNGGSTHCGVYCNSVDKVFIAYNDFYGNIDSPTNNLGGVMIWGSGNTFKDPLINTTGDCEIMSESSPAVDSGTNIPGIITNYFGKGPDMGWLEYGFAASVFPYESDLTFVADTWNLKSIMGMDLNVNEVLNNMDIGSYYAYYWNPISQEYVEPLQYQNLEMEFKGWGLWVYPRKSTTVPVPGSFLNEEGIFTINLKPGWNLISSSFGFICDVLRVSFNCEDINGDLWNIAANSGTVDSRIWGWDAKGNSYYVTDRLHPWKGYWVWANKDCYLHITGEEQTATLHISGIANLNNLGSTIGISSIKDGWVARIGLVAAGKRDMYNVIGTKNDAEDGISIEDSYNAPRVPDKNVRVELGAGLSYDIRKPVETIKIWQIKLTSEYEYEDGTLEYDLTEISKAGLFCLLAEKYTGKELARHGRGTIAVSGGKYGINKEYVLKVATEEYAGLLVGGIKIIEPKAYPNPVKLREREILKVEYLISEESEMKITIYDITGAELRKEKIGTRGMGIHIESLNIRNFPSGVYIYEIRAKSTISQREDLVRGKFVVIK